MAWPVDARYFNFAVPPAREMVTSAFLNAIQDAIIALAAGQRVLIDAIPQTPGGWTYAAGVWTAGGSPGLLHVPIPMTLVQSAVNGFRIKWLNAGGTTRILAMTLATYDYKFASAATTPATGTLWTNGTSATTGAWQVSSIAGPLPALNGIAYELIIGTGSGGVAADSGDAFAGIELY